MIDQSTLLEWKELSDQLKALKAQEARVRNVITSEMLEMLEMRNGRKTSKENFAGVEAVAAQSLAFKVDDVALRAMWGDLSDSERECIKYTPSLDKRMYDRLPPDSILHDAVTSKPSMAILKVSIDTI